MEENQLDKFKFPGCDWKQTWTDENQQFHIKFICYSETKPDFNSKHIKLISELLKQPVVLVSNKIDQRAYCSPPKWDIELVVYNTYDLRERAREKQRSRDQDAEDLRTGKKTREQLTKENSPFSGLILKVDFTKTGLPGYRKTK